MVSKDEQSFKVTSAQLSQVAFALGAAFYKASKKITSFTSSRD